MQDKAAEFAEVGDVDVAPDDDDEVVTAVGFELVGVAAAGKIPAVEVGPGAASGRRFRKVCV